MPETTARGPGRPRTYPRPASHDLIERSRCPACGADPGGRCRALNGKSYTSRGGYVPHFARREQAIRDGHYQP